MLFVGFYILNWDFLGMIWGYCGSGSEDRSFLSGKVYDERLTLDVGYKYLYFINGAAYRNFLSSIDLANKYCLDLSIL